MTWLENKEKSWIYLLLKFSRQFSNEQDKASFIPELHALLDMGKIVLLIILLLVLV